MSDPSPYEPSYNFSNFQASNPSTPLPAPKLDNEFDSIKAAVDGLVAALKDVRRSDGALQNQSVDFETLSLALQLTFDPTNGELVAAAIEEAQASAATATAAKNDTLALKNDAQAAAAAAEASASSVNLTLYMPKAGNFEGIGNPAVARQNIGAPNIDGSDIGGRLGLIAKAATDYNLATESGWYRGFNALNGPGTGDWLVEVIAAQSNYVTQIAYSYALATTSTSAVRVYRRHSYDNSGAIVWQPWESMSPMAVGQTIFVNGAVAVPGTIKENGALLLRADYPRLYAYAVASGNLASEAQWAAGNTGAFSTGDLLTTFRIPDARGEFFRAYDDGRGVDPSRFIGLAQGHMLRDHQHTSGSANATTAGDSGAFAFMTPTAGLTGLVATPGVAGSETRPRNIAKLACLVY